MLFVIEKQIYEVNTLDKYEYKIRAQEIKDLIAKKEYVTAMKIADTVDWRRVKSVVMLCTISDLYKINRRYEESKELLLLAYEKHPGGRMIVYSLCELCIKLDEVVQAVEYYKEFVQIAPKDNGRYVLQYKLYEAQEVSLEERIAVLEELKGREYREKWAYELAYLYHRVGLSTKCVEECDDLILWFGEGKYVTKAMELKMLHCSLTPEQQKKYKGNKLPQRTGENVEDDLDFQVKTVNVGQYDTMNLQKELAESMKEVLGEHGISAPLKKEAEPVFSNKKENFEKAEAEVETEEIETEIEEIKTETEDSEAPQEEESSMGPITRQIIAPMLQDTGEIVEITFPEEEIEKTETPDEEEVFFEDDTAEMPVARTIERNPENKKFENYLSQEYDGQISLVVPEAERVEKQITGQMSIEDILTEWERMKRENEQKRAEDVRKRVLAQTGAMFSEFDASTRQGVLADLEDLAEESIRKEAETAKKNSTKIVKMSDITGAKAAAAGAVEKAITGTLSASDIMEGMAAKKEEKVSKIETESLPETEELGEIEEVTKETVETEIAREQEPVKKEETKEAPLQEKKEEGKQTARNMTKEEKKLFGPFIQTKNTKQQILEALDKITLAAYTGNVIVTGEPGSGSLKLSQNVIKGIQDSDHNFSGRIAKIKGRALNNKNIENTLTRLKNGALIIEKAGDLTAETIKNLKKGLEQEKTGIIVIMEDTKIAMNKLLENNHIIEDNFNIRIDIEALDNDSLVHFGKHYAQEMEYSIDELGVLALYTRISDMQTSEHIVTTSEVKEIVDEAIYHANRKNLTHFMDILFARRYDEEDMIILRERDFAG